MRRGAIIEIVTVGRYIHDFLMGACCSAAEYSLPSSIALEEEEVHFFYYSYYIIVIYLSSRCVSLPASLDV